MLYVALLALLALGGGGAFWYEKYGPGKKAGAPPVARQITLDANLPDASKQAVIAAIMSQTDPAQLDAMTSQYIGFPWTVYELEYRAWELRGSQGTPPVEPTAAGVAAPTPAPATPASTAAAAAASTPPATTPSGLAASAVNTAITASTTSTPLTKLPPPGVLPSTPAPSAGPFDLSHATVSGAWQNDHAYIKAYQGALTFLAYKYSQPSWDPQGVDGNFGPHTQAAVTAFQTAKGLTADGKCGKGTATAIAAALTSTQTSGQGTYGAFPGAAAEDHVQGLGEDQVAGLGEDQVQGLGEDQVQGLGEDQVQGLQIVGNRRNDQVAGMQIVGKKQGFGSGAHAADVVEGLGEDQVAGARVASPLVQAALAAAAGPASITGARPQGGWYIRARDTDRVWPRKIAEIGSGVPRGTPGSLQHLIDLNPHLAPGGVMRQITSGDEVNIPTGWATNLRQRGFDVRVDKG